MDDWTWWIMTCGISLYFVMILLDFNKPSKKLMEQIDAQETRRGRSRGRQPRQRVHQSEGAGGRCRSALRARGSSVTAGPVCARLIEAAPPRPTLGTTSGSDWR